MQSFCVVCKKKSSPQSERAMYMSVCVLCIRVCVCVYVVFVRVCLCGCTIVCLEAEPPNQFIQESIRIKGEAVSLYGERSTPISTSQKWLRWRASAGAQARKMNSKSIFCDMSSLVQCLESLESSDLCPPVHQDILRIIKMSVPLQVNQPCRLAAPNKSAIAGDLAALALVRQALQLEMGKVWKVKIFWKETLDFTRLHQTSLDVQHIQGRSHKKP